ncbi:MAG: HXXEE domain-containing protein [Deltaproteobacteria bacterium]|nr:HXXEE domain-containing protein [Deltaproteobacteria bacterium]
MNKIKIATLCLVVVQIIHSIEEYFLGFYKQFPVFVFYNKAFSSIGQGMFFAFNISLVVLLLFCFLFVFFQWWRLRFPIILAIIEFINGTHHILWAVVLHKYFPGVVSGLLFIPASIIIIKNYKLLFRQDVIIKTPK